MLRILQQSSRLRHGRSDNSLLKLIVTCELFLASLHHFINSHVLLEVIFALLVAQHRLNLSISLLGLVTRLSPSDSTELLHRIWSEHLCFLLLYNFLVFLLLFDPLVCHDSSAHLVRSVEIDPILLHHLAFSLHEGLAGLSLAILQL